MSNRYVIGLESQLMTQVGMYKNSESEIEKRSILSAIYTLRRLLKDAQSRRIQ